MEKSRRLGRINDSAFILSDGKEYSRGGDISELAWGIQGGVYYEWEFNESLWRSVIKIVEIIDGPVFKKIR